VHELSLAQDILALSETEARKHGARRIIRVKLLLGEFAGVVRDALEFSFEVARAGTLAASAELQIEEVPLETRCPRCGEAARQAVNDFVMLCASCAAPLEILSGRELQVEYIEIE